MHTALHLAPVLAAEKSKVPFYVAGGLLVAWALVVSLALGLRDPRFPGGLAGQRAVSAVTAVLVLAALVTAVVTSGAPGSARAAGQGAQGTPKAVAPEPSSTSTQATPVTPTTTPTATAPAATAPAPGAHVQLAADPSGLLKFDTTHLSARAGAVTITMTNMSQLPHNVTIAKGTSVLGATPTFSGGSRSLSVQLKAGTYTFFCSIPGHRQAGMEGTLTVS